jgi:hypothetical protein
VTSEHVYKIEVRNDMKDAEKRGIGEYEDEGDCMRIKTQED